MATGQTLLDTMELLNQELQLQSGETDVTRGLVALNRAQDYFEARAALRPDILGSAVGTVTTSNSTEATAFPSGVLRIDRLSYIENSLPQWDLDPIRRTGGHRTSQYWPAGLISSSTTGKPRAYWTNGTNIYWNPLPSGTHTVRYYGFASASDISAGGTFAYPDIVILPLASFAVRLWKIGLEDNIADIARLAEEFFEPILDALSNFNRDGAIELQYTEHHTT